MTDRDWVIEQKFKGGITMVCRLCGKDAKRSFNAANTNYAEMVRAAEEYEREHLASDAHRAALEAFHSDDVPEVSSQEVALAKIFDQPLPTVYERRRRAARAAYHRESRRSTR